MYKVTIALAFVIICGSIKAQEFIGKWSVIDIPSPSIENSKLFESKTNKIGIYLPPSYKKGKRTYPVIYFLQGYTAPVNNWAVSVLDSLIREKKVEEVIYVDISGVKATKGSFYVNSAVNGNWEDFVVKDVVAYVDKNYRTKARKESRALVGLSMGGYGVLNLGIKHTDKFDVIYSLSPGLFDDSGLSNCQMFSIKVAKDKVLDLMKELSKLTKEEAHKKYIELLSGFERYDDFEFTMAYGMAFAPKTDKAPYFEYPFSVQGSDTLFSKKIWDKWYDGFGGIEKMITQNEKEIAKIKLLALDCGYKDEYKWITDGTLYYSKLLDKNKIPHLSVWHNGGHTNMFTYQLRNRVFPLVVFSILN